MLFSRYFKPLDRFTFAQRRVIIDHAFTALPASKKVLLNIAKILILTPMFVVGLYLGDWRAIAYAAAVIVFYPIVIHPLTLWLVKPYFAIGIKALEQEQHHTKL